MPYSRLDPAQGTVPASSTLVPGLQLSAVLGLGFVGAILVLDGGHSFDTCRAVGQSGLGGCATLWANLGILAVVIALVLLPVTMMVIRASRLRRHQAAPRLVSQPTRQAWTPAPLPPVRPRFVAPIREERSPSPEPMAWTPPGPSYIQPVIEAAPVVATTAPMVGSGAELDLLRRDFQALKAQLEASDPGAIRGEPSGEVIPFTRVAPRPPIHVSPPQNSDEPTPA